MLEVTKSHTGACASRLDAYESESLLTTAGIFGLQNGGPRMMFRVVSKNFRCDDAMFLTPVDDFRRFW